MKLTDTSMKVSSTNKQLLSASIRTYSNVCNLMKCFLGSYSLAVAHFYGDQAQINIPAMDDWAIAPFIVKFREPLSFKGTSNYSSSVTPAQAGGQ